MSNAIAVHVYETEHPIDWDCARVIEREKHFEGLYVEKSSQVSSHKTFCKLH